MAKKSKRNRKKNKGEAESEIAKPSESTSHSKLIGPAENVELVIGLAGPIGADIDFTSEEIRRSLDVLEYDCELIRMTRLLQNLDGFEPREDQRADERYSGLMDDGNRLRKELNDPAAMTSLAIARMRELRATMMEDGKSRRAFIIRQLKRPEEVTLLRRIYGDSFVLIAAHSDREVRTKTLAQRIADSASEMNAEMFTASAISLVDRDEHEDLPNGQQLRETFKEADLFVDPSDRNGVGHQVKRFFDLLFGLTISTPTMDEYAMFVAKGSARLSGSMARQVGAAIVDDLGSVVSTGTNDVPRFGGGVYWEEHADDQRDHILGEDPSDLLRDKMIAEIFERLREEGWLAPDQAELTSKELVQESIRGAQPILKKARVNAVIEYVRASHAEQTALLGAARRGVATNGCDLVVTTFPCHECTRLLIVAGIKRVVFVEPYPKSLATVLYDDSMQLGSSDPNKVSFEPFLGIAPRLYDRLFTMEDLQRKDRHGKRLQVAPENGQLRTTYSGNRLSIDDNEQLIIESLKNLSAGS